MLDWLRLIRASGLATIASNLLAAAMVAFYYGKNGLDLTLFVSRLVQGNGWKVVWVVLTSCLLYASGMLWNDLADVDRDRVLHPKRPLPSGRVPLATAYVAGLILAVGSLLVASQVDAECGFYAAGVVLSLALLYNFATKHVPYLGSLNMALVRFSHALFALLLLGVDYFKMGVLGVLSVVGLGAAGSGPDIPLVYPAVLGAYIFGVTLISELESRKGLRLELILGGAIMFGAIATAAAQLINAHWISELQQTGRYVALAASVFLGLAILGFLLWRVMRPWLDAVRTGRKAMVGKLVGAALSGIVLLDALIATAYHPVAGLVIVALYPVLRLAGRVIRMD